MFTSNKKISVYSFISAFIFYYYSTRNESLFENNLEVLLFKLSNIPSNDFERVNHSLVLNQNRFIIQILAKFCFWWAHDRWQQCRFVTIF